MATRKRTRLPKKARYWMNDLWRKRGHRQSSRREKRCMQLCSMRAQTIQQEREEVYAALQYAASFHCWVEEWKDCEELKPQPKEKWIFVDRTTEKTKHRTEWCAVTRR